MPDHSGLSAPDLEVDRDNPAASLEQVCTIARAHAEDVDRDGRFPAETINALRESGLLAALVPASLGGLGHSMRDAAVTCYALGQCCSSSAMILAMHHIQVAALVDHAGDGPWLRDFIGRVGRDRLLLSSVTSEVGIGGAMRTSLCAVDADGSGHWRLTKQASAISYGARSDALLVTARANPAAGEGDQVLIVVPNEPGVLERTGIWDSMGMRGTSSEAFVLRASGHTAQILPVPFAQIAAESMVPVSHLLWSSLWCGIASDAVARARMFLRARMRQSPTGMLEGAGRLVHAVEQLQAAESRLKAVLHRYGESLPGQSFEDGATYGMLKTSISEACLAVVDEAMLICGFAGYRNTGPYSVSRHLRDLHSARLMVHNDRTRAGAARALLMQAPGLGLA